MLAEHPFRELIGDRNDIFTTLQKYSIDRETAYAVAQTLLPKSINLSAWKDIAEVTVNDMINVTFSIPEEGYVLYLHFWKDETLSTATAHYSITEVSPLAEKYFADKMEQHAKIRRQEYENYSYSQPTYTRRNGHLTAEYTALMKQTEYDLATIKNYESVVITSWLF